VVYREDAAIYRLYAANCVEMAREATDADRRLFLFRMAQAWVELADRVGNNNDAVADNVRDELIPKSHMPKDHGAGFE
jgi:hypothetical protein